MIYLCNDLGTWKVCVGKRVTKVSVNIGAIYTNKLTKIAPQIDFVCKQYFLYLATLLLTILPKRTTQVSMKKYWFFEA